VETEAWSNVELDGHKTPPTGIFKVGNHCGKCAGGLPTFEEVKNAPKTTHFASFKK